MPLIFFFFFFLNVDPTSFDDLVKTEIVFARNLWSQLLEDQVSTVSQRKAGWGEEEEEEDGKTVFKYPALKIFN